MKGMTTNISSEAELLREVADFWTKEIQPKVVPQACVLASRITTYALSRFGIKWEVHHSDALAVNDEWYNLYFEQGVPQELLPPTAWSVGAVTMKNVVGTHRHITFGDKGFSGHLVVTTDEHFIDLSSGQFDRPNNGIITGAPLIVSRSLITKPQTLRARDFISVPITQGKFLLRRAKVKADYKWTPDWAHTHKRWTTALVAKLNGDR